MQMDHQDHRTYTGLFTSMDDQVPQHSTVTNAERCRYLPAVQAESLLCECRSSLCYTPMLRCTPWLRSSPTVAGVCQHKTWVTVQDTVSSMSRGRPPWLAVHK